MMPWTPFDTVEDLRAEDPISCSKNHDGTLSIHQGEGSRRRPTRYRRFPQSEVLQIPAETSLPAAGTYVQYLSSSKEMTYWAADLCNFQKCCAREGSRSTMQVVIYGLDWLLVSWNIYLQLVDWVYDWGPLVRARCNHVGILQWERHVSLDTCLLVEKHLLSQCVSGFNLSLPKATRVGLPFHFRSANVHPITTVPYVRYSPDQLGPLPFHQKVHTYAPWCIPSSRYRLIKTFTKGDSNCVWDRPYPLMYIRENCWIRLHVCIWNRTLE